MLNSRNVFIDTQYFVRAGLNVKSPAFESFKKLCEAESLFHITTTVVYKEVKRKIEQSINEALSARQNFKRKAKILETIEDPKINSLFVDINEEEIHKGAADVFENFIKECRTKLIDSNNIDTEELLDLYLNVKPPFKEGKKTEFPDAISLLSLDSHLDENDKIYLISEDGDHREFCNGNPKFIHIETLDKLLDLYNQHNNNLTSAIKDYIAQHDQEMKDAIVEQFADADVYNDSAWEDSEVEQLTVSDVGDIEPSIVFVNDDECKITFDLEVTHNVTVTGPDFTNGHYDREDDRVYTFGTTTNECQITESFTVELELFYEFTDGLINNLIDMHIYIPEISNGLAVNIEENEAELW